MTCGCEKTKEQDDNDDKKDCPEGQRFDVAKGECVDKEAAHNNDECPEGQKMVDGKCVQKEQVGDPKVASTQADLPEGDPGEIQMVDPGTCPEGHKWDAKLEICVPVDQKDPGDGQTQGTDKTASIEILAKTINSQQKQITALAKEKKKPTALVSDNRSLPIDEIAREMVNAISEGRNYVFHIPLEYLRAVHVGPADPKYGVQEAYRGTPLPIREAYTKPNKTIHEVVSISGTHATQDLDTDVAIVPGGISFIPVFQFAKVKQVPQGMDRARFFKTTLPSSGSQTVGTTPAEATQTLTSIEVTPSTITGIFLAGDYDEIENSPFDLLQAVVEASAASYDDFVATDMLDTVSAEGTLTPGLWIRADTGATITSSDIASVTFDETGIAFGREYLEDQGYLRGGVRPVCAMHPRQWRELITSTNVTSLATRSTPDIWLKAQLEELFGIQLVVSNAVENFTAQTNNAFNAIMFIPKHTYGIAVKRDVTVKFHDIGEDNQVRVNTTWRTKSGVIDATATVRISSTAP